MFIPARDKVASYQQLRRIVTAYLSPSGCPRLWLQLLLEKRLGRLLSPAIRWDHFLRIGVRLCGSWCPLPPAHHSYKEKDGGAVMPIAPPTILSLVISVSLANDMLEAQTCTLSMTRQNGISSWLHHSVSLGCGSLAPHSSSLFFANRGAFS
jgi:hypothetical protein